MARYAVEIVNGAGFRTDSTFGRRGLDDAIHRRNEIIFRGEWARLIDERTGRMIEDRLPW